MTLGLLTGCGGAVCQLPVPAPLPPAAEGMDQERHPDLYGRVYGRHLNPMLDSQYCGPMLYRGLMRMDEGTSPSATWPRDYQVSDDLLEYTFTLRDGVKFHDGADLTVEDVIFYHQDRDGG